VSRLKPESIDPDLLTSVPGCCFNYADPASYAAAQSNPDRSEPWRQRPPEFAKSLALPMSRPKSGLRLPIRFRPAAISAIGEPGRPRRRIVPTRGEEWPLPATTSGSARRAAGQPSNLRGKSPTQPGAGHHAYRQMPLIRRFERRPDSSTAWALDRRLLPSLHRSGGVVIGIQMANQELVTRSSPDTATMATCCLRHGSQRRDGGIGPAGAEAISKGKGGSMHMFSVEKVLFRRHGSRRRPVPLGTGLAFANNTGATTTFRLRI